MRVTAEAKAATRKRILEVARRLFAEKGFEVTTTRDIALAAEIASGTLFNYFPTKEAIVACLAEESLGDIGAERVNVGARAESLEEELFALVASGLRKLKPLRTYLPVLLETTLSPLAAAADGESAALRSTHLAEVARLAVIHGHGELSPVALQLYWTLYTGVLVFWANDISAKQQDTLALVDHSLAMYTEWLRGQVEPSNDRKKR